MGAEHLSLRREPDGPAGVDLSAEVLVYGREMVPGARVRVGGRWGL